MCFSFQAFVYIIAWLIGVAAALKIWAVFEADILAFLAPIGWLAAKLIAVVKILLWAALAIILLYFVADIISCLLGGGLSLPRLRMG